MMMLRSSPASPFGRKVKIAAAITGQQDKVGALFADTSDPTDKLRQQNPLGKIPTLVLDDGTSLYDSRVILEYFDWLAGGDVIIPADPHTRFACLTRASLADGVLDAAILQVYEERFHAAEQRAPKWLDLQAGKVSRALAAFEAAPPTGRRTIDHIGLACALGYLDLRFSGDWRATHRGLVSWLKAFETDVPSFADTRALP